MKTFTSVVRAATAALALMAASSLAHADTSVFLNFDVLAGTSTPVVSGSAADSVLGSFGSFMHFANPDTVADVGPDGSLTGTFHWVDATPTFGNVLVTASADAVSGPNLLDNGGQPIMLMFTGGPINLTQFSIQQDKSGFGNPQANGTTLAFLDASGHEIAGVGVSYTQFAQPGLTISSGPVANVSGVLLAGGSNYDNLSLVAAPVPEVDGIAMMLAGFGVLGFVRRRRSQKAA
jgi:hypothetical protein